MTNYFIFNGHSSLELGIKIKSKNIYSSPKRDLSLVSVPGRDGELVNSNKRYGNATITYTCFLPAKSIDELNTKIRNVKKMLYVGSDSYHELTDSYDPDFLRYAIFNSKLDITDQVNKIGSFTITFSALPFKYLITGLESVEMGDDDSIFNPYPFESKPYLKIIGNGNVQITISNSKGTSVYRFNNVNGYVECDSELMNVYKDTVLKNSDFEADNFPTFVAGENVIDFSGSISSVLVIPRWRCL